jgi:hypothetical protein
LSSAITARAAVKNPSQQEHRSQFAKRENRHERQRIHAADVGLAVGNVHRAQQHARAQRGDDADAALPGVPAFCCAVATASTAAPNTIAAAPPITLAQSFAAIRAVP